MGNKTSTPKTKKLERQYEIESDSDEEEENGILEIAEREECEDTKIECLSDSQDCEKCCKLYGTELFAVEDLSLDHLPTELQNEKVLDYIMMQEKIAVKLEVKKSGSTSDKYRLFEASGWACVSDDSVIEYSSCPLENCPDGGNKSHKAYGGITVFTNTHVVSKKEEGVNCKVTFFYDGRDKSKGNLLFQKQDNISDSDLSKLSLPDIEAWGLFVKQVRENKDLVAIETVFHDDKLFKVIAACSAQRLNAWTQIPQALKMVMKEHVIVISHPHGRRKVVSVGKLLCLEVTTHKETLKKETRYLAATCKGSSGAPVISGHYPYRPFTHSSKYKLKGQFENASLSY